MTSERDITYRVYEYLQLNKLMDMQIDEETAFTLRESLKLVGVTFTEYVDKTCKVVYNIGLVESKGKLFHFIYPEHYFDKEVFQ